MTPGPQGSPDAVWGGSGGPRGLKLTKTMENNQNSRQILQKILNYKTALIKTGIFSAILACWGVILFGTFLTFK